MTTVPNHLGGHCFRTHLDQGCLDMMIKEYGITSMLDVGSATGGMVDLAHHMGLRAHGIEGDFTLNFKHPERVTVHDFTQGPAPVQDRFDLVWCCAFVEHVEQEFVSNFVKAFQLGQYLVMTYYELPGHHHVNLKGSQWWIDTLDQYGFDHDPVLTDRVRQSTTMGRKSNNWSHKAWMRHYGLGFRNREA